MGIHEKTLGIVRYFTYYLRFPDGEEWVDQIPFVHNLQYEMDRTNWAYDFKKRRELTLKGETHWTDQNGVEHQIVIETVKRPRVWGNGRKLPKLRAPKGRTRGL